MPYRQIVGHLVRLSAGMEEYHGQLVSGGERPAPHRNPLQLVVANILFVGSPSVSCRMHRENFLPISNFDGEHDFSWGAMGR